MGSVLKVPSIPEFLLSELFTENHGDLDQFFSFLQQEGHLFISLLISFKFKINVLIQPAFSFYTLLVFIFVLFCFVFWFFFFLVLILVLVSNSMENIFVTCYKIVSLPFCFLEVYFLLLLIAEQGFLLVTSFFGFAGLFPPVLFY